MDAVLPWVLSGAFGLGVYLLFEALTNPRPPAAEPRRWRGVEEFLVRAGLRDVTPRDFVLFSLGSGLVCGLLAQLLLGWGLVSLLAAGAMRDYTGQDIHEEYVVVGAHAGDGVPPTPAYSSWMSWPV